MNSYPVVWRDLGLCDYDKSWALQNRLKQMVRNEGAAGQILFLEHPPTITLGYSLRGDEGRASIRSAPAELTRAGVAVVEVDRGGKATYHGPGQLVCYLILSLKELHLGVKRYVGKMQEVVLEVLTQLGLPAELDPAYPGVWVKGAKVAAVGIHVEDRITSHGFALNVDPDLAGFGHIVPCGIPDRPVTSLAALGIRPERRELLSLLVSELETRLRIQLQEGPADLSDL